MSAANQTWTFPANQKYIDANGIEHIINTSETLRLDFTDTGTGGVFVGAVGAGKATCTDGFEFEAHSESRFKFTSSANGAATLSNGEITFIEENNRLNTFEVISLNMADADGVGANNITVISMEQVANRANKMSWALITTA